MLCILCVYPVDTFSGWNFAYTCIIVNMCGHGGSDRWSKVHNIIKGVILSFVSCAIKDLNFCEIQYYFYCLIKGTFWKICSNKSVSMSECELSDY